MEIKTQCQCELILTKRVQNKNRPNNDLYERVMSHCYLFSVHLNV